MSLYPGRARPLGGGKYKIDDLAIEDSMAEAIEEEMADLFEKVKGTPLPDTGKEDRRLLFVAISRGILKYLGTHDEAIHAVSDEELVHEHQHDVELDVTMTSHQDHS